MIKLKVTADFLGVQTIEEFTRQPELQKIRISHPVHFNDHRYIILNSEYGGEGGTEEWQVEVVSAEEFDARDTESIIQFVRVSIGSKMPHAEFYAVEDFLVRVEYWPD